MKIIVFEDNKVTPSSVLLSRSFNGANIHFACGGNATNMFRVVDSLVKSNPGEDILVYFDLPPNNKDAYTNYEKFIISLNENNYDHVFVYPIICIEYYLLRYLIANKFINVNTKHKELVDNLIWGFDYHNLAVSKFVNKDVYRQASLERVYKQLLEEMTGLCCKNSFDYDSNGVRDNAVQGKFYENDCDCDRKFCKVNCSDKIDVKAEKFYSMLPVIWVLNDQHRDKLLSLGVTLTESSFEELDRVVHAFYSNLCDNMGVPRLLLRKHSNTH